MILQQRLKLLVNSKYIFDAAIPPLPEGRGLLAGDDEYSKNESGIPSSKTWRFEIDFMNDKGRPTKLFGIIVASGAGSVKDPLDKYDITAYVS